MLGKSSENVVGRPVDEPKLEAFNKLCSFLDNKDNCQYLLSDLMEMLLHFCAVSDKLYSEKHLLKFLSERYGNSVLISARLKYFETFVSFRPVAWEILRGNY
ncbi:hypothetical protein AVEN_2745-1 [Araneus ventricosus]|uniref:Uncharacterized protein n=1 Tax=Araneus ventricosus TaxID=182803 RepID=A0A4Y2VXI0_ARAVE|nr:hypothetical protein AVEN_2745-1 [Araneus ventricosus]